MFEYRIIPAGYFYADGGAMFGAIPKRAWNRKYPSDEQNCCILAMNCLLVWGDQRVVVLDTGVGTKDLGKLDYYRFFDVQDIAEAVSKYGFKPEQVTDVVLSHLHFDHCGGCTRRYNAGELSLTFPNAQHHVGKKQWENYLNSNDLEKDSYRREDMDAVAKSGLLRLHDKNTQLFDGFDLHLFDGHTDGQLVSFIRCKQESVVFAGDVIPTKVHLSDEWISAYDVRPLESLKAKRAVKKMIDSQKAKIIFYHQAIFP